MDIILQNSNKYNELCEPPVKRIHDCIHGTISLSKFAVKIIDTKIFQRLRGLSQLGTCNYVFPNAIHTRFEHSIGTYHMASRLLERLPQKINKSVDTYLGSIPELQRYYAEMYDNQIHPLDLYVCELIKIGALCHDLGHGPFSHVFDDVFLVNLGKADDYCASHEERSCVLLELIIKSDSLLSSIVQADEIEFIKTLISPSDKHNGFVYEIVSNQKTSLDVDKFDYLQRDIYSLNFNAKIDVSTMVDQIKIVDNYEVFTDDIDHLYSFTYPDPGKAIDDITNLFRTRHRLHSQVYRHKAVISAQLMVIEIFTLLDDILGLSESITDMSKFCKMTEGYIFNSVKFIADHLSILNSDQTERFNKAVKLINDLETRNLYSIVYHFVSSEKIDINQHINNFDDYDSIIFYQNKIGYVSGNKPNPLDSIHVYNTKNSEFSSKITSHKKNKQDMSLLIPDRHQEYVTTIYYKNKYNKKRISELHDYFLELFKNT